MIRYRHSDKSGDTDKYNTMYYQDARIFYEIVL